jgi:hypothetical protein
MLSIYSSHAFRSYTYYYRPLKDTNGQKLQGSALPFSAAVTWQSYQPTSSQQCSVTLAAQLSAATVTEGDVVEVSLEVANTGSAATGMVVAVVGVPGACS